MHSRQMSFGIIALQGPLCNPRCCPSFSSTPVVLVPSVVVTGGRESSRLACGRMKENPAVPSHSGGKCHCGQW